MLYSTIAKIPQASLDFLSKVPGTIDKKDYKTACEKDINRIGGLIIGETNLKLEFHQDGSAYTKSSDKFAFARNRIEKEAENIGIGDEDAQYFSYLMTNLCAQGFYALRSDVSLKHNKDLTPLLAEHEPVLSIKVINGKPVLEVDDNLKLFAASDNGPEYCVAKTIKYRFFQDKTMQFSMEDYSQEKLGSLNTEKTTVSDNCNKGEYEELAKSIFKALTSMSNDTLKSFLEEQYKENDPYNLLAMDCDQKKCEIVTRIINVTKCEASSVKTEEIEKLYAIEKLSKANPYTMARLIHGYIKDQPSSILDISNDMNDKLSEEAQKNINNITSELKERLKEHDIILALEDLCNIVLNFFLRVINFFELGGKSAVGTKEFDEFCSKLHSEKEQFSEGEQSNFTKTYLETKKKIYPEAQIS